MTATHGRERIERRRIVENCRRLSDGSVQVELSGELDLSTADQIVTSMRTLLATPPSAIVVDASAVTFIDSTGIGTLLGARRDAHAAGCGFRVVTSENVAKVTRLLGVHQVLTDDGDEPDPVA